MFLNFQASILWIGGEKRQCVNPWLRMKKKSTFWILWWNICSATLYNQAFVLASASADMLLQKITRHALGWTYFGGKCGGRDFIYAVVLTYVKTLSFQPQMCPGQKGVVRELKEEKRKPWSNKKKWLFYGRLVESTLITTVKIALRK